MKKLLLLLFCLGMFSVTSSAQSSNSERIKEIQTELDKAVEDGDFEKAAKLKKERDIRLEIETAIEAGDFDKAAELKAKLKDLENGGEQKKEPASEEELRDAREQIENGKHQKKKKEQDS